MSAQIDPGLLLGSTSGSVGKARILLTCFSICRDLFKTC